MKTEKKIFLEKDQDVDSAIDEIVETSATRIILNIPKNSVLGISIHNFQILKREAETAGKEMVVESVDEHVLELASLAKIAALNPVFRIKERAVADILPKEMDIGGRRTEEESVGGEISAEKPRRGKKENAKKDAKREIEEREIDIFEEEIEKSPREPEYTPLFEAKENPEEPEKPRKERGKRRKKLVFAGVLILIFAAAFFVLTYLLPHVTIRLTIKKTASPFSSSVLVSTAVASSSFSTSTIILPGQIISAAGNVSLHFASGTEEHVETKASGMLTVYNSYSSAPQVLVATTRFVSPGGKLFRSTERITVPGAKAASGTTTPGSAGVNVVAAEAGADYNVGPSTGWTIPGFEGTPRYDKFSAAALAPMTGGFVGTTTVPTKNDLVSAEGEIDQQLEGVLQSKISLLGSDNLKILPQSLSFATTSEQMTDSKDGQGFDILAEGTIKEIGFDENMMKQAVLDSVTSGGSSGLQISDFTVSYGTSTPDFSSGKMYFSASGTIAYGPNIDFGKVKSEILGKGADQLKAIIFALPGLEEANVSFWPFWVNTVPTNPSNVNIEVQ